MSEVSRNANAYENKRKKGVPVTTGPF